MPGIFQSYREPTAGSPWVIVYTDDILVARATEEEHLGRLDDILSWMEKARLLTQRNKCHLMVPSVLSLGHRIYGDGIHPLPDKVDAVLKAPTPLNVRELKLFLEQLSYYSQFLPNLSSVLDPLYRLLCKDVYWNWLTQEEVFQCTKELLPQHLSWLILIQR